MKIEVGSVGSIMGWEVETWNCGTCMKCAEHKNQRSRNVPTLATTQHITQQYLNNCYQRLLLLLNRQTH